MNEGSPFHCFNSDILPQLNHATTQATVIIEVARYLDWNPRGNIRNHWAVDFD